MRLGHGVAALVAHPVKENRFLGNAAPEQAAVLAIAGDHPVILAQRIRGAETGCLLAHVLRIGSHSARTLKTKCNIVELTAGNHRGVKLDDVSVGNDALAAHTPKLLVEVALRIENRDVFNLGFVGGGDWHIALSCCPVHGSVRGSAEVVGKCSNGCALSLTKMDRACLSEGRLEVRDQVTRVLETDLKTKQRALVGPRSGDA